MISRRLLLVLYVYYRVVSRFFFAIPFEAVRTGASRADFKLRMCRDAKSFILFHINFSIQFETMTYSFLRLCQMHLAGEYDGMHPYVIHCFNMVGFGYPVYLQLYLMFYGEAVCAFFNQSTANDQAIRKKYWNKSGKSMDLLETGISVIVPFVYFQGLCFGMYSLYKPSKPFFHCSLLKEIGWSTAAQIPIKLYECYMFLNCWHVIVSVWVTLCVSGFSLAKWTPELIPPGEHFRPAGVYQRREVIAQRKSLDSLREIRNSLREYQNMSILCYSLKAVYEIWIVGVSFFVGKLVAIYMGFAAFQLGLEQTLPWNEYMAYPTSCLFLLLLFAFCCPEAEAYHTFSCDYLDYLKSQPNKMLRKTAKSLQPMGFRILNMISFERGTGIEVMNDTVEEIADLVVGYNGDD